MAKYNIIKGEIHKIPATAKQHANEGYFVGTLLNMDCPFSSKQPKLVQFGTIAGMYNDALTAAKGNWEEAKATLPETLTKVEGCFESWVAPKPFYLRQMDNTGKIIDNEIRRDANGNPILYNKLNPFVMYYFDSTKQCMLPIDGNDVNTLGQRMYNRLCIPATAESAEIDDLPEMAENADSIEKKPVFK